MVMDGKRCKAFLLLGMLLFAVSITQAAGQGKIEGFVLDSQYGEPLPAANVFIEGTNLGTAANLNGKFVISKVPVGDYRLVIRYIGYQEKTVDVTVAAGEVTEVTVNLDFQSVEGEIVTVTAQAEGQIQAINQQLSSNTIANIVSEARIRELPDVNAAESIGRLPGVSIKRSGGEANKISIRGLSPKYNTVTVNGVRVPSSDANDRSVDLSLISSNMIDGIELKKAITPDMDADAVGGAVDLRLRKAPDEMQVNVSLQGGYNKIQDYYGNYNFSGTISNRFLDKKLGVIFSVNADNYDRSADKLSANYGQVDVEGSARSIISNLGLREESVKRNRLGGSLLLDYQVPFGNITFNTFRNQLTNDALYNVNSIDPVSWRLSWQMEDRESETTIMTSSLGIEQDFDWLKYDFAIATSSSDVDNPEDFVWRVSQEQNAKVDTVTRTWQTHASDLQSYVKYVDNQSGLSTILVQATNRTEDVYTAQFNIETPFRLSNTFNGSIKAGVKFRNLERKNDNTEEGRDGLQYSVNETNEGEPLGQLNTILPDWNFGEIVGSRGIPMSAVLDTVSTRDDFLNGDYALGYLLDRDRLMELTEALQQTREVFGEEAAEYRSRSIGSLGSDYTGEERYAAAYIMSEMSLGKYITLIPGIRWEGDESTYTGQRFRAIAPAFRDEAPSGFERLEIKRENDFWLPMVHINSKPTDWLQIRLARTETLIRPDYIQYTPITTIDQFSSNITAANSLLKPAHSNNYDVSVSVYKNKVGLFTVSGFTKSIEDLIVPTNFTLSSVVLDEAVPGGLNIPTAWYQESAPSINTYINNPFEATYNGVELDWQTHLWYLPSFLSGIVLNVNYTFIDSETEYGSFYPVDTDSVKSFRPRVYWKSVIDTSRTSRVVDQPKHIANLTFGYDFKGFSTRFSMIYQGDVITGVDRLEPFRDNFTQDYFRFDITMKQRIAKGMELFANFNNLNNRPDKNFRGTDTFRPTYTEYYGFTMDLGFRYNF